MTVYRCILADWAAEDDPFLSKVVEGQFELKELQRLNAQGYNIYWLPNYPSVYTPGTTVSGAQVDTFQFALVDMDLKDGVYPDKETFVKAVQDSGITPTVVVDSGNGVHMYWHVTDLDAMSFLRLSRRLMRKYNTDKTVCTIYRLLRVPSTNNTKEKGNPKPCKILVENEISYTCEYLDKLLPPILPEDEAYCIKHYNDTYKIDTGKAEISDKLPIKFGKLLRENNEVKEIWAGGVDDRSKADYRLGHIMWASAFTKEEALSVLVNTGKALARAPSHRANYAQNIVDKVWTYELPETLFDEELSESVGDILAKGEASIKGTRFPCVRWFDDTMHGFRLGQVIGLVAGSGVGKTAIALNMFWHFTKNNPDYVHVFVSLEQPKNEIADRWRTLCEGDTTLHEKVHVLSNYGSDSKFRNLSLDEIKDYLLKFKEKTGKKIGTVVIDHIGALKKQTKNGENQGLMEICQQMKGFAVEVDALLVMQSQAPREKAGIGDLELNKDAAYGTVAFESYVDYLITLWQPLKRAYPMDKCPTAMAFKFCKIRHKKQGQDGIQEDKCYTLFFDPKNEKLRELTQNEETAVGFFQEICTKIRSKDRKTDLIPYESRRITDGVTGNVSDKDAGRNGQASRVPSR